MYLLEPRVCPALGSRPLTPNPTCKALSLFQSCLKSLSLYTILSRGSVTLIPTLDLVCVNCTIKVETSGVHRCFVFYSEVGHRRLRVRGVFLAAEAIARVEQRIEPPGESCRQKEALEVAALI